MNTVVYASAKPWNSFTPVGSHGYAREFVRQNWCVAFLSTNITPWHRFLSRDKHLYMLRKAVHDNVGVWHEDNKLWEYVPWSLFHQKWSPRNWLKYDLGDFKRAFEYNHINTSPNIVWVDTPEYGVLFSMFPQSVKILRVADKNQFFQGTTKKIINYQFELAKQADLLLVTSFALEEEMLARGLNNVWRIPNGVEKSRFYCNITPKKPNEYYNLAGKIAVYAGEIQTWFDLELMKQVAQSNPSVNFIIIGKPKIDISEVDKINNLKFLGEKPPQDMLDYMSFADVGIIPFIKSEFVDAINPVKYYEYLACGLPVVSTYSYEFEKLKEPIFLAKTPLEFTDMLNRALALDVKTRESLREKAKEYSWSKRWQDVMSILVERELII